MKRWHVVALVVVLLVVVAGGAVVVRQLRDDEASRRNMLLPQVRAALDRLRAELEAEGIQTFIGSTRRTDEEQASKLASGVSGTSNSWHLLGRALELYVADVSTDPKTKKVKVVPDLTGTQAAKYKRLHAVAKKHGFEGIPNGQPFDAKGGKAYITNAKGQKIWDVAHLQFREGMTFAKAAAAAGRTVA